MKNVEAIENRLRVRKILRNEEKTMCVKNGPGSEGMQSGEPYEGCAGEDEWVHITDNPNVVALAGGQRNRVNMK